jgi:hypothetical protein
MKNALLAALAAGTLSVVSTAALAVSSVSYDFNGGAGGIGGTGFTNVYNQNPAGYTLGGGKLTMQTLPGDTFGQYETTSDPDSAQNVFYSIIDPLDQTTEQATVNVSGLNSNFHGGGIWMGTDEDHYVRLGVFHNTFLSNPSGPIGIELLRENQDRWSGATPPGQGDDIVSNATGIGGTDPQTGSLDVMLKLVRTGNSVSGFYSLDNGATFQPAGTFSGLALPNDPQGLGSNTIEENVWKVGVYAVGGGNPPANYAFDSFSASSVPEPASLGVLMLVSVTGGLIRRNRRQLA